MKTTVLQRLLTGDFNHMSQLRLPDGVILVTLTRRGDPHVYKLCVKDLYKPTQVVIKEEVTGAEERQ